jgi:quinoprotein glucose dehydrogenase
MKTRLTSVSAFGAAAGPAALLLCLVFARGASPPLKEPYANWTSYGGAADTAQYSSLKQIDKANVNKLQLAWFHPVEGQVNRFTFNPLIVDGVMFVLGAENTIRGIDAATGKQLWSHTAEGPPTDRGISYWESKDRSDRRLIFTANSYLQEVNARTGVTINTFGNDGRINLREGLNRDPKTIPAVATGSPGRVFENLIILGTAPSEAYGAPPGYLRAYDVLTGTLVWIFHTVPHPGEYG